MEDFKSFFGEIRRIGALGALFLAIGVSSAAVAVSYAIGTGQFAIDTENHWWLSVPLGLALAFAVPPLVRALVSHFRATNALANGRHATLGGIERAEEHATYAEEAIWAVLLLFGVAIAGSWFKLGTGFSEAWVTHASSVGALVTLYLAAFTFGYVRDTLKSTALSARELLRDQGTEVPTRWDKFRNSMPTC